LRGEGPNNPPVFLVRDASIQTYGFFPSDRFNSFESQIVHCGNGIAIENIEIPHTLVNGYALNGQAAGIEYKDCLFTNGLSSSDLGEDFFDASNNVEITSMINPEISADNGYLFENCLMDGKSLVDESFHDYAFSYFHGYDLDGALIGREAVGGIVYQGCVVKNWDDSVHWLRGREVLARGLGLSMVQDCFFANVRNPVRWDGNQGPRVFNRNVVYFSEEPWIQVRERSGGRPSEVYISNSIFSGSIDPIGGVRIDLREENISPSNDSEVWIVNNTFHDYSDYAIHVEGSFPRAAVMIANNIFQGSDEMPQGIAIGIDDPAKNVSILTNLFSNNLVNVQGIPDVEEGSCDHDPEFNSTEIVIPEDPIGFGSYPPARQNFEPYAYPLYDSGTLGVYTEVAHYAGDLDVDQTHSRYQICGFDETYESYIHCPGVGAQGITGPDFFPFNRSEPGHGKTFDSDFLCEPTPISVPTFVSERSDVNVDGVVNETDLLLLLQDWGRVSGP
ncbi:MAG: hypothetical protein KC964_26715, partial [Candidatus Omnitrophica bacterium]|nr:hypothetical protein [Candidatus Omnitrophota bacterium]